MLGHGIGVITWECWIPVYVVIHWPCSLRIWTFISNCTAFAFCETECCCWLGCFTWKKLLLLLPSMHWYWNRSRETLDSDANLLSPTFLAGSGSGLESSNRSSPMSLAMMLGDRRCLSSPSSVALALKMAELVLISLKWRLPLASDYYMAKTIRKKENSRKLWINECFQFCLWNYAGILFLVGKKSKYDH